MKGTLQETSDHERPLTEQFYRARKSLVLFSGLLFAWEFVGIEIGRGNIAGAEITIRNPEAAPLVLAVVVLYFVARTLIEWLQSSRGSRRRLASRVDLMLSLAIPAVAIGTFAVQQLSAVRVADYLTTGSVFAIIGGALTPFVGIGMLRVSYIADQMGFPQPAVTFQHVVSVIVLLAPLGPVSLAFLGIYFPSPTASLQPLGVPLSFLLGTLLGWLAVGASWLASRRTWDGLALLTGENLRPVDDSDES